MPRKITPQWTPEEINARLGISLAIYQKVSLGARHIAAIRQAGIAQIELLLKPGHFDRRNRLQVAEVLEACRKQGVTIASVHGLLDLPYKSEDETQRKIVVEESLSAIRFAEEVGASVFVGHFAPKEHAKKTVMELLDRTDGCRTKLTIENLGNLPGCIAMVDEIGSDRFGMTVDIGHLRDRDGINPFVKREKARQTLAQCGDRVFHVHLHDSIPVKEKPDHRPPLYEGGMIEWGEVFAALKDIGYKGALIFEDGRGEMPEEWIRRTAAFPHAFVQRYGSW